jgi:hypothetical protein
MRIIQKKRWWAVLLLAALTPVFAAMSDAPPKRVVVDGSTVPASSWLVSGGEVLVSCPWLDGSVAGLRCTATADGVQVNEVAESLAGKDADGCCAEWARSLSYSNSKKQAKAGRFAGYEQCLTPYPSLELDVFEECFSSGMFVEKRTYNPTANWQNRGGKVFVPLLEVAHALRMPVKTNSLTLELGPPEGYARTLNQGLRANLVEARESLRRLKHPEPAKRLKPTGKTPCHGSVMFWQRGEALRLIVCEGDVLSALEMKRGVWETVWQARVQAPSEVVCRPKSGSQRVAGALSLVQGYLGGRITESWGRTPALRGPLTIYGVCFDGAEIGGVSYRSLKRYTWLEDSGTEKTLLWFGLVPLDSTSKPIGSNTEFAVLNPVGGTKIGETLPLEHPFAREQRIVGR